MYIYIYIYGVFTDSTRFREGIPYRAHVSTVMSLQLQLEHGVPRLHRHPRQRLLTVHPSSRHSLLHPSLEHALVARCRFLYLPVQSCAPLLHIMSLPNQAKYLSADLSQIAWASACANLRCRSHTPSQPHQHVFACTAMISWGLLWAGVQHGTAAEASSQQPRIAEVLQHHLELPGRQPPGQRESVIERCRVFCRLLYIHGKG